MKLSDVFDALASSELNTLSVVEGGVIPPDNYTRVAHAVNRGILRLAVRFVLKKKFLTLQTVAGQGQYYLDSTYTVSSGNPGAYILDSVNDPFNTSDLLEILSITNLKDTEIPLDGSGCLVLTGMNILNFKADTKEDLYTVQYACLPRLIDLNNLTDPDTIDIELPLVYLNALIYFVASVFHSPTLSGLDGARANLDVSYLQKFEAECTLLESKGIDIDADVPTNLFSSRGFI